MAIIIKFNYKDDLFSYSITEGDFTIIKSSYKHRGIMMDSAPGTIINTLAAHIARNSGYMPRTHQMTAARFGVHDVFINGADVLSDAETESIISAVNVYPIYRAEQTKYKTA